MTENSDYLVIAMIGYNEKDVEDGTVTEEMVRLAILCEFEVIHRSDYEDVIKRLCE